MDIKLSVIMPSLNIAPYIRESVESVLKQSLEGIEILCIDGGSDDGTLEILETMQKEHPSVCVVCSNAGSYGQQVNLGMRMAKGEYIGIVETDDYVDRGMYEKLYNLAIRDSCDYVKCNYKAYWTDGNGRRFFIHRNALESQDLYNHVINPHLYCSLAMDDWFVWNGIYKKEFLLRQKISFSETKGAAFQDIGFLHKSLTRARRAMYVQDSLYNYCIDREGASSNVGRDMRFIFQEYRALSEDAASPLFLFRRASKSFALACAKSPGAGTWAEETDMPYKWMRGFLEKGLEDGYVCAGMLPDGLREVFLAAMQSRDALRGFQKQANERFFDFLSAGSGKPLAIFGCGLLGYRAFSKVREKGLIPKFFFDNDPLLWGKDIGGTRVLNPRSIPNIQEGMRFIIANERFADKIKKQIQALCRNGNVECFCFNSAM